MFGLFKKKLSDEELIKKNIDDKQSASEADNTKNKGPDFGDSKLGLEVTKIKAQLEGLNEQRQAVNERFTKINEGMGELRGMVMDTNRAVGNIEASATKAVDIVASVEPEKLMTEVRKQDSKLEALKANLESNETMMKDVMSEVKEMRKKMDFFRGVEQIIKLNEEIKGELIDIKKIEANVNRHSNKVETIFLDVEKRFADFDKFNDTTKELGKTFEKLQSDVDKLRVKEEEKADRKELNKYINKFSDFEKHTTNIINLLDERSKNSVEDIKKEYGKLVKETENKLDSAIQQLGIEAEKAGKEVPKSMKPKRSWRNLFKRKKAEETESKVDEEKKEDKKEPEKKDEGDKKEEKDEK